LPSLFYWVKTLLPQYNADVTAQTIGIGLAAVAAPAEYQIPPSRTWFKRSTNLTKTFRISLPAGNLDLNAIPDIEFEDTMIMVPAVLEYFTKDCLDFTYTANMVDGEETWAEGIIVPTAAARTESKRFYVVGQMTSNQTTNTFELANVDLRPFFDITTSMSGAVLSDLHVTDVRLVADLRAGTAANEDLHADGWCFGNAIECVHQTQADDHPVLPNHRFPVIFKVDAEELYISNIHFAFEENRTFFITTNDFGDRAEAIDPDSTSAEDTCFYFHTRDCRTVVHGDQAGGHVVCTVVGTVYRFSDDVDDCAGFVKAALTDTQADLVALVHLGKTYQDAFIGNPVAGRALSIFDNMVAESSLLGPVFQSKRRISQHLCAPVLNPNMRIGCTAPLNFETGHLPPELRDFRLELRDVDFSFLPGKVSLEPLVLYEFNGGNQVVSAEDNLLSLPQFRSMSADVGIDGGFEFEMFSPYGMPSHIALFCRDTDRSRDHMTQPLIKQLSIMCTTTQKKSNTILEADVHQLYHITQRNVNQRARYNRSVFNRRQVVLMSAEDIGMMGLSPTEYQLEKRAQFQFKGTVDQLGRVTALLVFNNRGLYIQGKHMSVVRLKE